jgi:hypothetical protein
MNMNGKNQPIQSQHGELEMERHHFIIIYIIQWLDLQNLIHLEVIKLEKGIFN